MKLKKWHSTEITDVLQKLNSTEEGLTTEEATLRLQKNGKNELPKKKKDSLLKIFLRELTDPIVLLLLFASIVSFLIKEKVDAIAILFIILVDLILGTYQEWKANKNVEALTKLIEVKTKVLRNGIAKEIDASELVVGDIVLLTSGDKISADMRLIESSNLSVDESILTGESTSVEKDKGTINKDVILAERKKYALCWY